MATTLDGQIDRRSTWDDRCRILYAFCRGMRGERRAYAVHYLGWKLSFRVPEPDVHVYDLPAGAATVIRSHIDTACAEWADEARSLEDPTSPANRKEPENA